MKYKVQTTW